MELKKGERIYSIDIILFNDWMVEIKNKIVKINEDKSKFILKNPNIETRNIKINQIKTIPCTIDNGLGKQNDSKIHATKVKLLRQIAWKNKLINIRTKMLREIIQEGSAEA